MSETNSTEDRLHSDSQRRISSTDAFESLGSIAVDDGTSDNMCSSVLGLDPASLPPADELIEEYKPNTVNIRPCGLDPASLPPAPVITTSDEEWSFRGNATVQAASVSDSEDSDESEESIYEVEEGDIKEDEEEEDVEEEDYSFRDGELCIVEGDDEDEDTELEIDKAVVAEIQAEKPKDKKADVTKEKELMEPMMPSIKADLTDEIRVAQAVFDSDPMPVLDPALKVEKESRGGDSDMFGIAYQNMKTEKMKPDPTAMTTDPDVTAVANYSMSSKGDTGGDNASNDNEFEIYREVAKVLPTSMPAPVAPVNADEEKIVEELKQATEKEKSIIKRSESKTDDPESGAGESSPWLDHMTVGELHSMYKRGLGDQSVRMMDDQSSPTVASINAEQSSTIKKLFSKGAIPEEEEEEEEEVSLKDAVSPKAMEAVNDWNEVEAKGAIPHNTVETKTEAQSDAETKINIKYNELVSYYHEADVFMKSRRRSSIQGSNANPLCSCLRPKLKFFGALEQRNRILCIAATPFDPSNEMFALTLQTIYCKLTKTTTKVPITGSHWEQIGFQGTDPSTDLRGCGMLSLLQMLFLVEEQPTLAETMNTLANDSTRHFPLACTLINVTLQCVITLRSGTLYKECNRHQDVFKGINMLYAAIVWKLTLELPSSKQDIPLAMQKVLNEGKLHPESVLSQWNASIVKAMKPTKKASVQEGEVMADKFTELARCNT